MRNIWKKVALLLPVLLVALSQSYAQTTTDPVNTDCPFDLVVDVVQPLCPGGEDGAIYFSSPTDAPVTYDWLDLGPLPVGTTDSVNFLFAGIYQIEISDDQGCVDTISIEIVDPAPLEYSIQIDRTTCYDEMDGAIHVIPVEGSGLIYTIDSGVSSQIDPHFENLGRGQHILTIETEQGCLYTDTVQVSAPPPINTSVAIEEVTCPNGNDGSAEATGGGGTGVLKYSLDGSIYTDSRRFENLIPGNYTMFTRDENECTTSTPFSIEAPVMPDIYINTDSVSCQGEADGSLIIIIESLDFTDSYEYSIDGVNYQQDSVFNNLPAGVYDVYVRNQDSCTFLQSVEIEEPSWPGIQIHVDSVSCPGASDGQLIIIIESLDLQGSFTYSIDGMNFQSDTVFSGLPAGTYTLYISDHNGCLLEIVVEIEEPLPPGIQYNSREISCYGESDGLIKIVMQGGRRPFRYSLDGQSFQESPIFEELSAGEYEVQIMDGAQCTFYKNITLVQPDSLTMELDFGNETCDQNNGWINIYTSGGTSPYNFQWNNGATFEQLEDLSSGVYLISVSDDNNCSLSDSLFIQNEKGPEILETIITDVECHQMQEGIIELSVFNSHPPLTYEWSNGAATKNIYNIGAGAYDLTITDDEGCVETLNVMITEPEALLLSGETNYTPSGAGIQLDLSGGVKPYQLNWSNKSTSMVQTGLPNGTYSVTVTDANNCTESIQFSIDNPFSQEESIRVFPNPNNGQFILQMNFLNTRKVGVSLYNELGQMIEQWDNREVLQENLPFDISHLSAAMYFVVVNDGNKTWSKRIVKVDK